MGPQSDRLGCTCGEALSRAAVQEGVSNVSGSLQQTCLYFIPIITEKQHCSGTSEELLATSETSERSSVILIGL